MAYSYTSLADSKKLVQDLTGITDALKAVIIEQNLADSAATLNGVVYYRPYYVAARQLERNRQDQSISEADGAKFTNLINMIKSLLGEQLALDLANDWTVPEGYSAQIAMNQLCGCSDGMINSAPIMSILVG